MRHLRLFLSSPGDLFAERKIALDVIDQMHYDPAFRGKLFIEVIAWDKKGAGTPMLATMTPQEAINEGLPKPSECDIVVVLFWTRMGTPLPPEYVRPTHHRFKDPGPLTDDRYLSGTEWEFIDAFDASKSSADGVPLVVVYQRTEKVLLDDEAPDFDKKLLQKRRVRAFFDTFTNPDGSIKQGYNPYEQPEDFKQEFDTHLRKLLHRLLESSAPSSGTTTIAPSPVAEKPLWEGSPFPGLRAFTEKDAPIFFGRGRETDALAKKVENERFVAVVGASGSGKSSLVAAGLLPRLKDKNASITRDWHYVRFTPGSDPLTALAETLLRDVPPLEAHPMAADTIKTQFVESCRANAVALHNAVEDGLKRANADEWVELLIYVDQFEELFTLTTSDDDRQAFVDLLTHASDKIRVVITMRADFYHRAVPYLEQQLRTGTFTLDRPDQFALLEMIKRPAERAALDFEDGLPEQIVHDTGNEPGALALMAYALDELYHDCKDKQHLTFADYKSLDGVQGAIGKRAESVFAALPGEADTKTTLLHTVFNQLVTVDENGTPTRRRWVVDPETLPDDVYNMIAAFADARLLTTDQAGELATVDVAHEALFRKWPTLVNWISQYKDDLYLLSTMRRAAALWCERGCKRDFLWLGERGQEVQAMLQRLQPELNDVEQAFARPEAEHLLDEIYERNTIPAGCGESLEDTETPHARRSEIGFRLSVIGDPRRGTDLVNGTPDIVWCYVDVPEELRGKKIEFVGDEGKFGNFEIKPFYIAKYLVTYSQFEAFLDADDGFDNDKWWEGLTEKYRKQEMNEQRQRYSNYPRDSVSWYQTMAFSRWLNHRLQGQQFTPENAPETSFVIGQNLEIRLPTEWEWQFAATGGNPQNKYPWGEWDSRLANTSEAGLSRTTAVGMYPAGAAACGGLDMSGNLMEWCINDYDDLSVEISSGNRKPLRGGSFYSDRSYAACASRYLRDPDFTISHLGFRVVCAPLLI